MLCTVTYECVSPEYRTVSVVCLVCSGVGVGSGLSLSVQSSGMCVVSGCVRGCGDVSPCVSVRTLCEFSVSFLSGVCYPQCLE